MKARNTFSILFILGFLICNAQENTSSTGDNLPQIINRDNTEAVKEFRKMDLDSYYTDLLDPKNVTEDEYQGVVYSWKDFHGKISYYLKEVNFDWEIEDSAIRINNRIYFNNDGTVNYYVFKVENPNVTPDKRKEFEGILKKFTAETKINYTKDEVFAQCGMVEYQNK